MIWRSAWLFAQLGGCGTETGNPELVVLSYNARSSAPDEVALGTQTDTLSVGSVWLRLGEIALTGNCEETPVEVVRAGIGFADHADPAAFVQQLEIRAESICTLETSLDPDAAAVGEPPEVAGTAVALVGTLSDGRAFEVLVRETIALSLVLDDEPIPAEGSWLLSFDVATWIDVGALIALDGDPVTVSSDTHADVYAALVERFADGVQLHHDADDDGAVDPDERRIDLP